MQTADRVHSYPRSIDLKRAIRNTYGARVETQRVTKADGKLFSVLEPPSRGDILPSLIGLANALSWYPVDYIKDLEIKRIRISGKMIRRGTELYSAKPFPVSGTMDDVKGNMYLLASEIDHVTHHELIHQVMSRIPTDLTDQIYSEWDEINERFNLAYVGFTNAFPPKFIPTSEGFVSGYAQSDIVEDIPETVAAILAEPQFHLSRIRFDRALEAKTSLSFQMLAAVTDGIIGGTDWQKLYRSELSIPQFHLNELKPFKFTLPNGEVMYFGI